MSTQLKQAIENLKIAEDSYTAACIAKFGFNQADSNLYVEYVGLAWKAYLKAGGNLTMINA